MAASHKQDEEDCLICLEPLKNPIKLSCNHSFCAGCIEGWRSKYDALSDRTCPKCRAALPPTKEMKSQLAAERQWHVDLSGMLQKEGPLPMPKLTTEPDYEGQGNYLYARFFQDEHVHMLRSLPADAQQAALRAALKIFLEQHGDRMRRMEQNISASDQVMEVHEDESYEELPLELCEAAGGNDVKTVLDWLGPDPSPERINAKCSEKMERTLLHEAEFESNIHLMRILLQMGAQVDPLSAFGSTPFSQACSIKRLDMAARLLLQWGAENGCTSDGKKLCDVARECGNGKLAKLLETPLGGRRCEIVGLQQRKDLNGKTGVAERYLSKQDVYVFTLEDTTSEQQEDQEQQPQQIKVRPNNLKRRDRTPLDCGSVVEYLGEGPGGQNMFQEGPCFSSKEEADEFLRENKELLEQQKMLETEENLDEINQR